MSISKREKDATSRIENRNRKWLLLFSVLYIPLFSGAFFGWGPMQLMLEENGAFEERCNSKDDLPCASQTTRLLNVQLVATFVLIFAPLLGMLSDKCGAVSLMYFAAACGCTGLALLTLSASQNLDNLLFFTFILLGFMAVSSSIMIVETGLLFVEKTQQRVISFLNTLFDAGALTYLALWAIQKASGASLEAIAGVYLAIGVVCFGGAVYFWRIVVPVKIDSLDTNEEADERGDATASMTAHTETNNNTEIVWGSSGDRTNADPQKGTQETFIEGDGDETTKYGQASATGAHTQRDDTLEREEDAKKKTDTEPEEEVPEAVLNCNGGDDENPEKASNAASCAVPRRGVAEIAVKCDRDDSTNPVQISSMDTNVNGPPYLVSYDGYIMIAMRPPFEQLKSKQFVTLVVFYAFYGARNVFVLTTARDFLAYLGDDETGNKYITIFTLLTPASMAALPFMDWILNQKGHHAALQSINFLAIAHGVIQISSENLNAQVLGFIVFSFFRCFLFTVVFSFLPTFMGGLVVGRAAGIMTCAMGILAFINIPLANLAVNQFDGNFFWPNLFYTLASVPFIFAAWSMGKGVQKEKQVKALLDGDTWNNTNP